jgi:predicted GTPase
MAVTKERVLIIGAAGRDFHNFNVFFRQNEKYEVVGFTATQIPNIESRQYPPCLSGPLYPKGLPIWPESELETVIKTNNVQRAILSYSDLNNQTVMNIAHRVLSAGADFGFLCPEHTWLKSKKPVICVVAVRTGCGKSQTSRYVAQLLRDAGLKPVAVRHPMPYGDLSQQIVQRFSSYADLDKHKVTVEEREEYEMHIKRGTTVYAGVDYGKILEQAENEADVIIFDGGNNDFPFYKPDFWITIADPFRAGHELGYYPGSVNFRRADVIVINKVNSAPKEKVAEVLANAQKLNPSAKVVLGVSEVTVDHPEQVMGKHVLCIDDGPTLTHGEMPFGAGKIACEKYGAKSIADPRPYAKGSLKEVLAKWSHLEWAGKGLTLPAMGYYDQQLKDLKESIEAVPCDVVLVATPIDLAQLIKLQKPYVQVSYELVDGEKPHLRELVNAWIAKIKAK